MYDLYGWQVPTTEGTANTSHGITYSYDDGNPTTYKNASFAYDAEDRLTAISSPAFSAAYDGDGLRAKKTAAGVTTYYVYDGGTPVAERASAALRRRSPPSTGSPQTAGVPASRGI